MQKSNRFATLLFSIFIILFMITGLALGEDALYIKENGNVGIGTTAPDSSLTVYGSTAAGWNSGIELTREDGGNARIAVDVGGLKFRTPIDGDNFYFRDNDNNTTMIIKDGGNVGIGTIGPEYPLEISRTGGTRAQMSIYSAADVPNDLFFGSNGQKDRWSITSRGSTDGNGYPLTIWRKNGAWNRVMTIDYTNGNVGIGTTSPYSSLTVYGSTAAGWNSGIELTREDGGNAWIAVDENGLKFRTPIDGDGFYFRDNDNVTSLFIEDGGNVGISDTTPSQRLDVAGNVRADDFIEYSNIYIGDALSKIENITYEKGTENGDWADVDHSTLPEGLRIQTEETVWQNTKTNEKNYKRNPSENEIGDWIQTTEIVEGRSLGNSVQFNLQAIKQLLGKVLDAEDRVAELEAQIVDLQKQLVELKR